MREKIDGNVYKTFDEFEKDFNLIWKNCMSYNAEDTIYYRAAVRLRDQGKTVIRSARRMVERTGMDPESGLLTPDAPSAKDRELTQEGSYRIDSVLFYFLFLLAIPRHIVINSLDESSVGSINNYIKALV